MKKIAALPAENARERKKPIGSIGWRARSSHATKAAMSTTPGRTRGGPRGCPAGLVAAHEGPHEPQRAAAHQREAAEVELV